MSSSYSRLSKTEPSAAAIRGHMPHKPQHLNLCCMLHHLYTIDGAAGMQPLLSGITDNNVRLTCHDHVSGPQLILISLGGM